jgi:hypothetical protein
VGCGMKHGEAEPGASMDAVEKGGGCGHLL